MEEKNSLAPFGCLLIVLCIGVGLCGLIDGSMGGAIFAMGLAVVGFLVIALLAAWQRIKEIRDNNKKK